MSGLLWQNNGKQTLEENVRQAVERYAQRFGVQPKTVYIHPVEQVKLAGCTLPVAVETNQSVLVGCMVMEG